MSSANLPSDSAPIQWLVVATVGSHPEAAIILGRLNHIQIPTTTQTDSGAFIGSSFGTIRILVPAQFFDLAQTTLFPDRPLLTDGELEPWETWLDDPDSETP